MQRVEDAIREFLRERGYDLSDENFKYTPIRFERMLSELVLPRERAIENAINHLKRTFSVRESSGESKFTGMLTANASLVTLCPHHLLPVEMYISFAYVPTLQVVGLSKIVRFLQDLARALWLQEEFTEYAVDLFYRELRPAGCMIIVKGRHGCMVFRGVREANSIVTTSAVRGLFCEDRVKMEALALMK